MIWVSGSSLSSTPARSEEHTSELQSQSNLVCRLLLEKKKHIASRRNAARLHTSRRKLSCGCFCQTHTSSSPAVVRQWVSDPSHSMPHRSDDTVARSLS